MSTASSKTQPITTAGRQLAVASSIGSGFFGGAYFDVVIGWLGPVVARG